MGLIFEYLIFDGKSSLDFDVHISGAGTFVSPERDVESISIPGRNGDLHIDNGRFKNVSVTYSAYITNNFKVNFEAFKAFLLSQHGYKRLQDTYHPDFYRLAEYHKPLSPKMAPLNVAGTFDITFDCDPRRFLVSGDDVIEVISTGSIINNTLYNAKPLIRAYGSGTITINGVRVVINSANVYTDIDCETQEAYKGSTSCNGNITLTDGVFPTLSPGLNSLAFTGTKLEVTPKWWTV